MPLPAVGTCIVSLSRDDADILWCFLIFRKLHSYNTELDIEHGELNLINKSCPHLGPNIGCASLQSPGEVADLAALASKDEAVACVFFFLFVSFCCCCSTTCCFVRLTCASPCRYGAAVCGVDQAQREGEADEAAAHRPRRRREGQHPQIRRGGRRRGRSGKAGEIQSFHAPLLFAEMYFPVLGVGRTTTWASCSSLTP